jgi:hypothetical protein
MSHHRNEGTIFFDQLAGGQAFSWVRRCERRLWFMAFLMSLEMAFGKDTHGFE